MEAKILEELDSLGLSTTAERPHPRRLTYADLGKLNYLQAVIKVSHPLSPCRYKNTLVFNLVWDIKKWHSLLSF